TPVVEMELDTPGSPAHRVRPQLRSISPWEWPSSTSAEGVTNHRRPRWNSTLPGSYNSVSNLPGDRTMPVGLGPLPVLHPVPGFRLGISSAGIKRAGRKDVVVMEAAEGSSIAGVFTLNAFCAAPVTLCRQHLNQSPRYLLVNT